MITFKLYGIVWGRSLQEVQADPYPDGDLEPVTSANTGSRLVFCMDCSPEGELYRVASAWVTRQPRTHWECQSKGYKGNMRVLSSAIPPTLEKLYLCSKCAVLAAEKGVLK